MERERRSGILGNRGEFLFTNYGNGMDQRSGNRKNDDNVLDRRPSTGSFDYYDDNYYHDYGDCASSMTNHLLPVSPSSQPAPSSLSGYIEHPVSKFDTLAGVAIRYGVEVADIKRLNGLVTDIQMFALKSLQIPLSRRHHPSTCLSNGFDDIRERSYERTPPHHVHGDLFDSFQSLRLKSSQPKVSLAMSSLQGYYGLNSKDHITKSEVIEMAVFEKGGSHYLEDKLFIKTNLGDNPNLSRHRKSKSLVIDFINEKGDVADQMTSVEESFDKKLVRRRQKSESNFTAMTPEMVLKGDTSGGGGGFSTPVGKGLALRSKATVRTSVLANTDMCPTGLGDLVKVNCSLSSVRKSSSTFSLQDQEMTSLSSMWLTSKWNLKPDLQSLPTATITRPIFDGLPKPLTSRRNKTALD